MTDMSREFLDDLDRSESQELAEAARRREQELADRQAERRQVLGEIAKLATEISQTREEFFAADQARMDQLAELLKPARRSRKIDRQWVDRFDLTRLPSVSRFGPKKAKSSVTARRRPSSGPSAGPEASSVPEHNTVTSAAS